MDAFGVDTRRLMARFCISRRRLGVERERKKKGKERKNPPHAKKEANLGSKKGNFVAECLAACYIHVAAAQGLGDEEFANVNESGSEEGIRVMGGRPRGHQSGTHECTLKARSEAIS